MLVVSLTSRPYLINVRGEFNWLSARNCSYIVHDSSSIYPTISRNPTPGWWRGWRRSMDKARADFTCMRCCVFSFKTYVMLSVSQRRIETASFLDRPYINPGLKSFIICSKIEIIKIPKWYKTPCCKVLYILVSARPPAIPSPAMQ